VLVPPGVTTITSTAQADRLGERVMPTPGTAGGQKAEPTRQFVTGVGCTFGGDALALTSAERFSCPPPDTGDATATAVAAALGVPAPNSPGASTVRIAATPGCRQPVGATLYRAALKAPPRLRYDKPRARRNARRNDTGW
jgi:hypothetical protein